MKLTPLAETFGPKLPLAFYRQNAIQVAHDLIGSILVHRYRQRWLQARIVETEAYVGHQDLACHASKGLTPRTATMFLPGGVAYIYLIYGMYQMLNVVCSRRDDPQAVLIRAAEPLGWTADLSGPGKLTRALHITRADNARNLTGEILFFTKPNRSTPPRIMVAPRVGVDYALHWKDAELRFFDADSPAISKPYPRLPKSLLTQPSLLCCDR